MAELKKKQKTSLHWHLFIDCPECGLQIDLAEDVEDDGVYSEPIFTNRWDDLNNEEVECPKCEAEFLIQEVEY